MYTPHYSGVQGTGGAKIIGDSAVYVHERPQAWNFKQWKYLNKPMTDIVVGS